MLDYDSRIAFLPKGRGMVAKTMRQLRGKRILAGTVPPGFSTI
jgi:hypothetical protein